MPEPVVVDAGCCPFCLSSSTGEMRLDKNGKPYFRCLCCGTRAFIPTRIAYETFKYILSNGVSFTAMAAKAKAEQVPAGVGV